MHYGQQKGLPFMGAAFRVLCPFLSQHQLTRITISEEAKSRISGCAKSLCGFFVLGSSWLRHCSDHQLWASCQNFRSEFEAVSSSFQEGHKSDGEGQTQGLSRQDEPWGQKRISNGEQSQVLVFSHWNTNSSTCGSMQKKNNLDPYDWNVKNNSPIYSAGICQISWVLETKTKSHSLPMGLKEFAGKIR